MLADGGFPARIVEGSAVAAEVFLSNTNTLHTAVRVAIFVVPDDEPGVMRTLRKHDFKPCEPSGDRRLLRMAAESGRRAVHVLFDGDPSRESSDDSDLHPGDPAAARARAVRLGTAWLDLIAVCRRVRHDASDGHETTESFEVQLIEAR